MLGPRRMVGGTLWGSVVASTKTTWAGGSSRVFKRAPAAALESMVDLTLTM